MSRVALVTGASGGIGRAAAMALAADGLEVACGYHQGDAAAKETVRAIEEAGGRAQAFAADVSQEEDVKVLIDSVTDWAGAPTVLVAAAGTNRDGLAVRYPADALSRVLGVNTVGTFLSVRAVLPAMLRVRWGRVVLVSSAVALRGNAGQSAYAASKSAVVGMARSLAREYGGRGITVNVVCPGLVDTDMTAELPAEARRRLLAEVPAGRPGTPEETAAVIRFLAGDGAGYVNGAVIAVDGGLTA